MGWREIVGSFPFPYNDTHFMKVSKTFNYWFPNVGLPAALAYLYGGSVANYVKHK